MQEGLSSNVTQLELTSDGGLYSFVAVDRVSYSAMAASIPSTQDPDSLPGEHSLRHFALAGQERALATTSTLNKFGSVDSQERSDTSKVAENEADAVSIFYHRPNPFGDETYPASAGSSVRSKVLKYTRSVDSAAGDIAISGGEELVHQPQPSTSLGPLRKTVPAFSSSFSRIDTFDDSSKARPKMAGPMKKPPSAPAFGVSEPKQSTSPAYRQLNRGNWARVRNHAGQSTLPEGSTIDDILRQYKGSDVESLASDNRPASSFNRNLSRMIDESSFLSDFEEDHGPSQRRYGPYIPPSGKVGLPRSTAQNNIASIATASEAQDMNDLVDTTSSSFLQPQSTSPRNKSRMPLEHAIMQLRSYSDESIATSHASSTIHGDTPTQPSQNSQQVHMTRPASETMSIDEETRRLAQTALCYNQVSMDPSWYMDKNARIPTKDRVRQAQEAAYETSADILSKHEDDEEDWVTVDTDRPRLGHRISSSIGTLSTLDGINRFDIAERVVQHPGAMHYEGNYRQLDLKQGKMPIIAPSRGPYRVNGYLQDSMRTRENLGCYKKPSPLNAHKHPFVSQPPNISPNSRNQPRPWKSQPGRKPFPPSSSSMTADESEMLPHAQTSRSKLAPAGQPIPRLHDADENENDSIYSTKSSISTTHPRQLSYGRQGHRIPEHRNPITSFSGPSSYQRYGSSSDVNAPGNQLSRAQGDGLRGAAYTGEGRPRRDRPRYIPSTNTRDQFGTPYAIRHQVSTPDTVRYQVDPPTAVCHQVNTPNAVRYHVDTPGPVRRPQGNFEIEEPGCVERNAKQEKISLIFIILCNFFPPILVFLWAGQLDNIMGWWSRWEFHEFSLRGKRIAGIFACLWLVAVAVAAALFSLVKWGIAVNRGH
ncbi:hypothetical protein N431DRAFT_561026 [Stipitochalara longipes BDJ]|nr:hypothetical protein N431DRAFT_561026 [Stipitochalara longipes BDJ]